MSGIDIIKPKTMTRVIQMATTYFHACKMAELDLFQKIQYTYNEAKMCEFSMNDITK